MIDAEAVKNAMLMTEYESGARGPAKYDCWGMVCHVCQEMGWPVPYDPLAASQNPKELLRIFRNQVKERDWVLTDGCDGAVAFFGSFAAARHAGIVIMGGILHTREDIGPEWQPLSYFENEKIEFAKWVQ